MRTRRWIGLWTLALFASTQASDASDATDSGCQSCLSAPLSWGYVGGETVWRLEGTIDGCRDFVLSDVELHKFEDAGKEKHRRLLSECRGRVPGCDSESELGMRELSAVLARPDVMSAFDDAPILYGRDLRAYGSPIFRIASDGREVLIGSACRSGTAAAERAACSIPPGLDRLRQILFELHKQLRQTARCKLEGKR